MYKKTLMFSLFGLLFLSLSAVAQVAWLTPENPSVDEPVTLTFNPNEGNAGLVGFSGDVYFHTGVITSKSIDGGDWKHVVGDWGQADDRVKMKKTEDGLYSYTFVIRDFYALKSDETAQQLALVFRNENGSLVGKTKRNEDILLPVNGYIPPVVLPDTYLFENRSYLSHTLFGNELKVLTDHGLITVLPYQTNAVEVYHYPKSVGKFIPSHAVNADPELIEVSVTDDDNWVRLSTDSLQVLIHKSPVFVAFVYQSDTVLQEERGFFDRNGKQGLRFEMQPNERFFGLGERANAINLTNGRYNLYNRPKYGYEIGARDLNYSIPLVVSNNRYLLFFDNPQKGYADLGETEPGIMEWGAIGGPMKYFFIVGSDYKAISYYYSMLTGFQPLPPIWALGNLQSRMAYRTQKETDSIVTLMQQENFPIDAIILDFYWFGDSILGIMGRLNWYTPNWPDPEKMIADFRKKGVKTILITEPYIIDSLKNFKIASDLGILATDSEGQPYVNEQFYFGPAGLIDIFNKKAGEWFWEQYKPQIDKGVAGWWGDLGEPENHPSDQFHVLGSADAVHNIYAHYWHKMLYEKYRQNYPETRLFNLNRAGFAGSQRYSIYPWTGDVSRSWGGLQAQIPLMIHMGMSGLPFIHADAGGFAQGTHDEILYTRWLQMACFSPILRPHGSGIPSEPVYFNESTREVVRNFMNIRYSLLPYIYTLAYRSHTKGEPIVRPLFYEFPKDSLSYNVEDEYMFGPDLLVAPILTAAQEMRKVYLPSGTDWYDFWNNKKSEGGQTLALPVKLADMPVFVRSGAFVAQAKPVNSTDDYNPGQMSITYYMSNHQVDDSGSVFIDDGRLFGSVSKSAFKLIKLKAVHDKTGAALEIHVDSEGQGFTNEPEVYDLNFQILGAVRDFREVFIQKEAGNGGKDIRKAKAVKVGNQKEITSVEVKWDGEPMVVRFLK